MITARLQRISRFMIYALLIFTPLARASVQGWAVSIMNMVTLIALTGFLLAKSLSWNWKWESTALDKPVICLLIICLLSSLFSVHPYTSIWSIIQLINYIVIFYLTINLTRTRFHFRQVVYLIIGVATLLSIIGLIKTLGNKPFPWWEYPEANYGVRMTSTFGCPNHLAGYMEMAFPLSLGLLLLGYRSGKLILILYFSLLLLTALILTLSRGGWIGTFVSLVFLSGVLLRDRYFKRKRLLLTIIAGVFVAAFISLASTPVVERIRTLEEGGKRQV